MEMVTKKMSTKFFLPRKKKNKNVSKIFIPVKIFLLLNHRKSQILQVTGKALTYHAAYNFVYQLVTISDPVNITTLNIKLWLIVIP